MMMARTAPLVVFAGPDGSGKSSQIAYLRERLARAGMRADVCWARGGYTPLFLVAKRLLRRAAPRRLPPPGQSERRERALGRPWIRRLWLLASLIDLALYYAVAVRLRLCLGRAVIGDRWLDDTRFDFRLNFPAESVERGQLWRWIVRTAPRPDAAFLLLVPLEVSLERSRQKVEPFPDTEQRFQERLALYEELARVGDWIVLDGRRPAAELAEAIARHPALASHVAAAEPRGLRGLAT